MLNRIPHWFCLFCNKFFYLSGSSSGSLFRSGLLCSHSWWVYLPKRCSAAYLYVIISRFMGQSGSKAWLRSIGRACAAAGTPARVKGKLLRNRHQSYMKPRHAKLDNLTNEKCHFDHLWKMMAAFVAFPREKFKADDCKDMKGRQGKKSHYSLPSCRPDNSLSAVQTAECRHEEVSLCKYLRCFLLENWKSL